MKFFSRLPILMKVLVAMVPLFLLWLGAIVVLENHFHERDMMNEARKAAMGHATIIKESMVSMMVNNMRVDTAFVDALGAELDSVQILVNELYLRPEVLTPELQARRAIRPPCMIDEVSSSVLKTSTPDFRTEGDFFRAVVPFKTTRKCQECHAAPLDYALGAVDIRMSVAHVWVTAEENEQRFAAIFIFFSLVGIFIGAVIFRRFVGSPIRNLVNATTEISTGLLESGAAGSKQGKSAEGKGSDEVQFLTLKFDQMRVSLKEKIRQIDEANKKLSLRNAEIEDALSRLRQAQEELVRNERLAVTGRMTAQLSHEINNPIHNIQSLLETSLHKLPDEGEARDLITIAREEVARMANLTRQMLEFSRGDLVDADRVEFDMRTLLEEVFVTYKEPLHKRNIELHLDVSEDLPPVRGSRDKLKQVFLNLLNNADDSIAPPGEIFIKAEGRNDRLLIEVSDTGCGIPPGLVGRIFDAFFTTKKEVSGVGLGLFVTYGIIQQHGGSIHVSSEIDKGTTFSIHLPGSSVKEGLTVE